MSMFTALMVRPKSLPQSLAPVTVAVTLAMAGLTVVNLAHAHYTTTLAQKAQALAIAESQGIPESELKKTAPERYTVKRHDTLWGISGLYLKSPWQWPALWGMNKTQIANPHLIYPGQVLVLTRKNGLARLGLADGIDGLPEQKLLPDMKDDKLSPSIRSEPILPAPIYSINLGDLSSFLSQPLIADEDGLKNSGYVLTGPENRVFSAEQDKFYARNLPASPDGRYYLYRPGKPLRDPETGKILAYEAFYLGDAQLELAGDPARLKITKSKEELARGDRIMPYVREPALTAAPHAPDAPLQARIMSSYNGVEYAGSNMIVSLNKGRSSHVEVGHVLSLWRVGDRILDSESVAPPKGFWDKFKDRRETVQIPDEEYGQVIVFRVFEHVSYALIVGTTRPAKVGDRLTQP